MGGDGQAVRRPERLRANFCPPGREAVLARLVVAAPARICAITTFAGARYVILRRGIVGMAFYR